MLNKPGANGSNSNGNNSNGSSSVKAPITARAACAVRICAIHWAACVVPIPAVNAWAVICVAAADPAGKHSRSRSVAYGGMMGAFILLTLTASAWLPTADLAILSLSSLALAIAVIETGLPIGWILYGATGLISLAWPGLAFSWPYLLFFGPYPLLRAIFDSRLKPHQARLIRLLTGLLLAIIAASLFGAVILQENLQRYGRWLWILLPFGIVVIIGLYDAALGMLIQLYSTRLRKKG